MDVYYTTLFNRRYVLPRVRGIQFPQQAIEQFKAIKIWTEAPSFTRIADGQIRPNQEAWLRSNIPSFADLRDKTVAARGL